MKLKAGYKYSLFLAVCVTAVVLCTLPFIALKKDVIYFYSANRQLSSSEIGFVSELKHQGFAVKINPKDFPPEEAVGFFVDKSEYAEEIVNSKARFNFLYKEDYYPIDYRNQTKLPVVLTPYRDLYEHYTRSNIKNALFSLGVNMADFSASTEKKSYPLVYNSDNNQNSPIADMLKQMPGVRFIGSFWEKGVSKLAPATDKEKGEILGKSRIAVIYSAQHTANSKKVPLEAIQAAAAGALVFSSPNQALADIYGENIVFYEDEADLKMKASYYLNTPETATRLARAAQKITAEKLSSAAAAARFKELLNWLKKYTQN